MCPPNIEESLIKEEVYSRLKVMVDSLPEKEREVVYLRIYKQLSFKEIERLTKENSNPPEFDIGGPSSG
jgi:DNA-directed RNA polymerase specialized sigma24 family protein